MAKKSTIRYSLLIPESTYRLIESVAKKREYSVIDMIRRFIRLGLFVESELLHSPNAKLVLRRSDGDEEVIKVL